jgi:hypothetical protein
MSADLAPGVEIEFYRGKESVFRYGQRFVVTRVFSFAGQERCSECLPGWRAPCIEVAGYTPPPLYALCSCCFRPVRRGQSEHLQHISTPAPPREVEHV